MILARNLRPPLSLTDSVGECVCIPSETPLHLLQMPVKCRLEVQETPDVHIQLPDPQKTTLSVLRLIFIVVAGLGAPLSRFLEGAPYRFLNK